MKIQKSAWRLDPQLGPVKIETGILGPEWEALPMESRHEGGLTALLGAWPFTVALLHPDDPIWWNRINADIGADLRGGTRSGRLIAIEGKKSLNRLGPDSLRVAVNQALYGLWELHERETGGRAGERLSEFSPFAVNPSRTMAAWVVGLGTLSTWSPSGLEIEVVRKYFTERITTPGAPGLDWSFNSQFIAYDVRDWLTQAKSKKLPAIECGLASVAFWKRGQDRAITCEQIRLGEMRA